MGKYDPLTTYLKKQQGNSVVLTFAKIEEIIGDYLATGEREYFTGWDNRRGGAVNDSFLNAGWKTVMVDLENEKVKFQRI